MKFSTKIILSFAGVMLLLLAIGITSQYLNREVKNRVMEESEEAIQKLQLSGEMGNQLYRSLINIQYFLEDRYRKSLSVENKEADINTQKARKRVKEALTNFSESLSSFERLLIRNKNSQSEPAESQQVNIDVLRKLKTKFELYTSLVTEFLTLAADDYADGKEFFTVTIEPYFRTNLLPLVEQLRIQTQENLSQEIDKLNMQLSEASNFLFIATAGAFMFSVILAYFLYRSVALPLRDLSLAVQRTGAGNLEERIEVKTKDELGQLATEFNRMAENLSKTTVSKNFVDDIINSMADALIVTDDSGSIQRVNASTVEMLGYKREEELLGRSLHHIFSEEEELLSDFEQRGKIENYEALVKTKNGDTLPVSLSLGSIRGSSGNEKGMVCVASDITQRKKAEDQIAKSLKEKEILLAEVHHRVKNNLAVISGLLQLQLWETENEAAEIALKDSQLRVQSIALVHEKLYQSESLSFIQFDQYIRDLLQAISNTYLDTNLKIAIKTDLNNVVLTINQAIPCSLLLNELIVNAYKHAFEIHEKGNIEVSLREEEGKIHLRVKDNGTGFPEDFDFDKENSLGMSLINTLIKQLHGQISVKNDGGAVFEVAFEAEEVV